MFLEAIDIFRHICRGIAFVTMVGYIKLVQFSCNVTVCL